MTPDFLLRKGRDAVRYFPRSPSGYPAVCQYAPPGHFRRSRGLPPKPPHRNKISVFLKNG